MLKVDDEFLNLNKKLVYSIVNKYANDNNREDLYQVGMMAVIKSSESYDSSKNTKFSTYAYKNILGEILRYLRENKNIRPSRDMIKNNSKILKTKEYIYSTEGRCVKSEELSNITGIPENRISEIEKVCSATQSLDSYINDDENTTLQEIIPTDESISLSEKVELKEALETLNGEERNFIYQRFYENRTQIEIAKERNTNQVKIYRYERNLLDKLKSKLS